MIEFRSVKFAYNGKKDLRAAIQDASFKIESGEFVLFTGNSGAGKSTLLKMIYKAAAPTEGDILVFGRNLKKIRPSALRQNMGYVFQDYQLLKSKTAYENIAYVLECLGKNPFRIRKAAMQALEMLGIAHKAHHFPNELSGGEQQRVVVARAIVNNPAILICDEPTSNLDPENTRVIIEFLKEANRNGTTVLLATHDQSIIDSAGEKTIYVNEGVTTILKKEKEAFDLASYAARRG